MGLFNIAGLIIKMDIEMGIKNLDVFRIDTSNDVDLECQIGEIDNSILSDSKPRVIAKEFDIYMDGDRILFVYKATEYVKRAQYSVTEKRYTIEVDEGIKYDKTKCEEEIFYSIRDCFFVVLQERDYVAVHSSSVIYNGFVYLFSAASGGGKTTHTNMWTKLCSTEILNGDVAAISIKKGIPEVYGMPWCGSSNMYMNKKIPLGGIFFIQRGEKNEVHEINNFISILNLSSRCFTPTWTSEKTSRNLEMSERIINKVFAVALECTPNEEAVYVAKEYIDKL